MAIIFSTVATGDLFLLNHIVLHHANFVTVDKLAGLPVPSSGAMAHLMLVVATCAILLCDSGKDRLVFFIIFYPVQVALEAGWVNLFFRIHDVGRGYIVFITAMGIGRAVTMLTTYVSPCVGDGKVIHRKINMTDITPAVIGYLRSLRYELALAIIDE